MIWFQQLITFIISIFVLNCELCYLAILSSIGPVKILTCIILIVTEHTLLFCVSKGTHQGYRKRYMCDKGCRKRYALDSAQPLCVLYNYTQCRITISTIQFRRLLVLVLCMWVQIWYNVNMLVMNLQMYEFLWTPRYCPVSKQYKWTKSWLPRE